MTDPGKDSDAVVTKVGDSECYPIDELREVGRRLGGPLVTCERHQLMICVHQLRSVQTSFFGSVSQLAGELVEGLVCVRRWGRLRAGFPKRAKHRGPCYGGSLSTPLGPNDSFLTPLGYQ